VDPGPDENGGTSSRTRTCGARRLPARLIAYDIWAGAGKPGSAKREAFRARTRSDLTHVFGLLRDGKLTAKIAARFPLSEVAAAMELSESSHRTALGKIILAP
jgi:NADPH:quinone reductase-like Zn-dependent oxidoreductase